MPLMLGEAALHFETPDLANTASLCALLINSLCSYCVLLSQFISFFSSTALETLDGVVSAQQLAAWHSQAKSIDP